MIKYINILIILFHLEIFLFKRFKFRLFNFINFDKAN